MFPGGDAEAPPPEGTPPAATPGDPPPLPPSLPPPSRLGPPPAAPPPRAGNFPVAEAGAEPPISPDGRRRKRREEATPTLLPEGMRRSGPAGGVEPAREGAPSPCRRRRRCHRRGSAAACSSSGRRRCWARAACAPPPPPRSLLAPRSGRAAPGRGRPPPAPPGRRREAAGARWRPTWITASARRWWRTRRSGAPRWAPLAPDPAAPAAAQRPPRCPRAAPAGAAPSPAARTEPLPAAAELPALNARPAAPGKGGRALTRQLSSCSLILGERERETPAGFVLKVASGKKKMNLKYNFSAVWFFFLPFISFFFFSSLCVCVCFVIAPEYGWLRI